MTEAVVYPLPLPDGSTVLVTVHWDGHSVHHVDCPTYQELHQLCAAQGHDPVSWGRHFDRPGSSARARGAARLWDIVLTYCRNPLKDARDAEEAAWRRRNPGATFTAFGARTGD